MIQRIHERYTAISHKVQGKRQHTMKENDTVDDGQATTNHQLHGFVTDGNNDNENKLHTRHSTWLYIPYDMLIRTTNASHRVPDVDIRLPFLITSYCYGNGSIDCIAVQFVTGVAAGIAERCLVECEATKADTVTVASRR